MLLQSAPTDESVISDTKMLRLFTDRKLMQETLQPLNGRNGAIMVLPLLLRIETALRTCQKAVP